MSRVRKYLQRVREVLDGARYCEQDAEAAEQRYDAKQAWAAMSPQEQREARRWADRVTAEDKKRNPEAYK